VQQTETRTGAGRLKGDHGAGELLKFVDQSQGGFSTVCGGGRERRGGKKHSQSRKGRIARERRKK